MRHDTGYFPRWALKTEGTIMPDERLPTGQTVIAGLQHVVAMFGSTVLAPILMGFDPNVAILFSGVATLIFFMVVGGRVPSYLGSSFAFIGPVVVATGATVGLPNPNIGVALGGIIAAGALYAVIGAIVAFAGHAWVERVLPPVLTGAIVAAIGLVLAPIAVNSASGITTDNAAGTGFARWIALLTVGAVGAVAVYAPGMSRRLPILIGGGGEKVTLRIVAQHATIWNGQGEPDVLGRKNRVLDGWCARVGRDPKEIERSAQIFGPQLDRLDEYLAEGITHLICDASGPDYDLAPLRKLVAWRDSRAD